MVVLSVDAESLKMYICTQLPIINAHLVSELHPKKHFKVFLQLDNFTHICLQAQHSGPAFQIVPQKR